jgi:hypothetical protein
MLSAAPPSARLRLLLARAFGFLTRMLEGAPGELRQGFGLAGQLPAKTRELHEDERAARQF